MLFESLRLLGAWKKQSLADLDNLFRELTCTASIMFLVFEFQFSCIGLYGKEKPKNFITYWAILHVTLGPAAFRN